MGSAAAAADHGQRIDALAVAQASLPLGDADIACLRGLWRHTSPWLGRCTHVGYQQSPYGVQFSHRYPLAWEERLIYLKLAMLRLGW